MTLKQVCPVCGEQSCTPFLSLEEVPVFQNVICETLQAAVGIGRGGLQLTVCESCGFVFNQTFEPEKVAYGPQYDNTQSHSPYFEAYISGLVYRLVYRHGVKHAQIVEVGCGKGLFLKKLVEFAGADNTGHGFDPSYIGPEIELNGRLRFVKQLYNPETVKLAGDVRIDVIVCRHVIEHIADPVGFLRLIRQTLQSSPQARLFFETPCVEWILRNQVVWDFFYEHCSYFTAQSLTTAFEIAGFAVKSVEHVFGGQYLWLEASVCPGPGPASREPGRLPQLALEFALVHNNRVKAWADQVQIFAGHGGVALWGAGAKGVTFANLIDPACRWITCVVDMNPHKQGHFLPGTGHPIVSYEQLESLDIRTALVMNPNYKQEIERLLSAAGSTVKPIILEGLG